MLTSLPRHFKAHTAQLEEPPFLFSYKNCAGKATFNRPKALNSMSYEMAKLLREEIPKWNANKDLHVRICFFLFISSHFLSILKANSLIGCYFCW